MDDNRISTAPDDVERLAKLLEEHTHLEAHEIGEAVTDGALGMRSAATLRALSVERDRLREALREVLSHTGKLIDGGEYLRDNDSSRAAIVKARAALGE